MIKRGHVISAAQSLPEEFEEEDLLERVAFLKSVEEAVEDVRAGNGIPHEEVIKQFQQWRVSHGPTGR